MAEKQLTLRQTLKAMALVVLLCLITVALVFIYTDNDDYNSAIFSRPEPDINHFYTPDELAALNIYEAEKLNFLRIQEMYFSSRGVQMPWNGLEADKRVPGFKSDL